MISLGIIPEATNVVVRIHTGSGLTGTGECAPIVFIVGETQETVFEMAKKVGKLLINKDPFAIEDRLWEVDQNGVITITKVDMDEPVTSLVRIG